MVEETQILQLISLHQDLWQERQLPLKFTVVTVVDLRLIDLQFSFRDSIPI